MHHTCHRQHRGSRVLGLWWLSIHQLLCHKSAHLWYTPMVIFVMLQHQHWQCCKTHNVPLITSSFLSLGNIAELIIPVTFYRTDIVKVLVITVNHAIVPSTVKDISLYFEICIRLCLLFSGWKKKHLKYVQIVPRRKSTFDFILKVGICVQLQPCTPLIHALGWRGHFIGWNLACVCTHVPSRLVVAYYTTTLFHL